MRGTGSVRHQRPGGPRRSAARGREPSECARPDRDRSAPCCRPSDADAVLEAESRTWWVYLITGALWIIFGFVVLSARSEITTVWAVAIYAGILFFLVGIGELVTAFVVTGWRWLHALFGIAAIIAGIFAFGWPGQTFITLADHPRLVPAVRRHLPDRRRVLRAGTSTSGGGCSSSWA